MLSNALSAVPATPLMQRFTDHALQPFSTPVSPHLRFFTEPEGGGGGPAEGTEGADDGQPKGGGEGGQESGGKPLSEMTAEEQADYWKRHARRHEQNAKGLKARLDELAPKAEQFDALQAESQTDQERAVEAAKAETRAEVAREYTEKLVRAEFKSAAAGRIEPDRLTAIIDDYDLARFVGPDGDVDADAVAAKVDLIAPKQEQRVDLGQGKRRSSSTPSMASGAARYEERHKKK